ncbi:MAG: hypothetical protein HKN16_10735 [Saprospiraceae bacterium]|nr:hypothetical protein [Saprospiraceae bacterium]
MEEWELEFEWLRIRHFVKDTLDRKELPDLNGVLFMIGIQEFGRWDTKFTKEQKQDLMHIAVCRLLAFDQYYDFVGRDQDGWPHYEQLRPLTVAGAEEQEALLIKKAIQYFRELEKETQGFPPINKN